MLTVFSRTVASCADEAVAALQCLMRTLEADRYLLLKIVLDGRTKFFQVFGEEFRGMAVDSHMLEMVWQWVNAKKGFQPEVEFAFLAAEQEQRANKEDAQAREMAQIETAARYGLRLKGDEHFDGEKVTIGVGDSRLD